MPFEELKVMQVSEKDLPEIAITIRDIISLDKLPLAREFQLSPHQNLGNLKADSQIFVFKELE